ncbi:uncharacterized protein CTRU02_201006 [Colletotrichum truncatum]|uniref:Uncharacterized protein n=1 Tax=Colletotrichum truncatum TaxID=5467 RepID=A0ACC3ZG68_COLTU|nr:uncharacterized protein CTRU02_00776 [Colletotrichum truncatum]KAF6802027.1 hypothetical protein CTRU02_00776 [Colletotrichum truncatum]
MHKRKRVYFNDIVESTPRQGQVQEGKALLPQSPRQSRHGSSNPSSQQKSTFRQVPRMPLPALIREYKSLSIAKQKTHITTYIISIAAIANILLCLDYDWSIISEEVEKTLRNRDSSGSTNDLISTTKHTTEQESEEQQRSEQPFLHGSDDITASAGAIIDGDSHRTSNIQSKETELVAADRRKILPSRVGSGETEPQQQCAAGVKLKKAPRTLEGLKRQINEKNSSTIRNEMQDQWNRFTSAGIGLIDPSSPRLREEDCYQIGELLFCRMFGGKIKDQLYDLLVECNYSTGKPAVERRFQTKQLASDLRQHNAEELARFAEAWGRVDGESLGLQAAAAKLHLYAKQFEVWDQWQTVRRLYQGDMQKALEMKAFLGDQGIRLR